MFNRTNLAESRLASGISSAATGFSLTTGEGQYFPASNFLIGCYPADYVSPAAAKKAGKHEWMIVGTRTVDALSSVARGALGSTALDFNESGKQYVVYNPVVAEELLGFNRLFADAGGDDDYVVSSGFALASLTAFDELVIQLKVATPNTSAPTLAFDSVEAKSIKTMTASGLVNAPNYSMIATGRYFLQWSQADDCWVLLNPSTPAKLTGNVLPTFDAAVHVVGTEFLLVPENAADSVARIVTGTPLRYVYQVDTDITYQCTSEDGDESNDWTAVGSGKIELKYHSNGTAFVLDSNSSAVIETRPEYYVDPTIAASNPALKIYKTITEVLASNRIIILAVGNYTETPVLTNLSNIRIVGLGSTYFTGSALSGGAIFNSSTSAAAFKIQGGYSNVTVENIGCVNSSTGDCLQVVSFDTNTCRKIRLKNITTYQSNGVMGGHNIVVEELGGDIRDVVIENSNCYGGSHGIIIKAKDVTIRTFYCQDQWIYPCAAISDNKSAAGRKSRALNVHFIDGRIACLRELNGSEKLIVYSIDFFSEDNANGVTAAENITFDNIEVIGLSEGIAIGAPNPSGFTYPKYASGRSQIDPENIKISNCNITNCAGDGVVIYSGNDIGLVNCTAKNNVGRGFNSTPPNAHNTRLTAIGCHASGNGDNTFTGWTADNL